MKKQYVNTVAAITSGNVTEYAQLIAESDPSLSKRVLALTAEIDKKHRLATISVEVE